jgi:hypothetical protein
MERLLHRCSQPDHHLGHDGGFKGLARHHPRLRLLPVRALLRLSGFAPTRRRKPAGRGGIKAGDVILRSARTRSWHPRPTHAPSRRRGRPRDHHRGRKARRWPRFAQIIPAPRSLTLHSPSPPAGPRAAPAASSASRSVVVVSSCKEHHQRRPHPTPRRPYHELPPRPRTRHTAELADAPPPTPLHRHHATFPAATANTASIQRYRGLLRHTYQRRLLPFGCGRTAWRHKSSARQGE